MEQRSIVPPTEKGDFLALDLGGTNFRVLHVRVVEEEQKVLKMDSQICAIPQEMMLGTGEQVQRPQIEMSRLLLLSRFNGATNVSPDGGARWRVNKHTEGQRAGQQGRGMLINMDYQTYSRKDRM